MVGSVALPGLLGDRCPAEQRPWCSAGSNRGSTRTARCSLCRGDRPSGHKVRTSTPTRSAPRSSRRPATSPPTSKTPGATSGSSSATASSPPVSTPCSLLSASSRYELQSPRRGRTPFAERFVRTVRRDCLDHLLLVSQRHLEAVLAEYVCHLQRSRAPPRLVPKEHTIRSNDETGPTIWTLQGRDAVVSTTPVSLAGRAISRMPRTSGGY